MNHFEIQQNPLRIQAAGTTRAGLIVASVKGLFAASDVVYPEQGEEMKQSFEFEVGDANTLILSILRLAASSAHDHGEAYADISFALITDKKAKGELVGRKLPSAPVIPSVHGIDGEIVKDGDGVWRATIGLGT